MQESTFLNIFRFVWKYLSLFPKKLFLALFLSFLATISDIIPRIMYGRIVDILTSSTHPEISKGLILFLGIFLSAKLARYILQYLGNIVWHFQSRAMEALYKDSFTKVQSMGSDWFANTFTGATVRKINRGVFAFERFSDLWFFSFYPTIIVLIGVVILTFNVSHLIGISAIIGTIFYLTLSCYLAVFYITPRQKQNLKEDTKSSALVADSITSNSTVKSFGAEQREYERFAGQISHWRQTKVHSWWAFITTTFLQNVILVLFESVLFFLSLFLWKSGEMSIGNLVLVLFLMQLIWGYLFDMGNRIREFLETATDIEETIELHMIKPHIQDIPQAKQLLVLDGNINFQKISFRYPQQKNSIFQKLSLSIPSGQKIALVGRSGSGKSTFIKLIQRLYDVQEGTILIDNQNIAQVTQESLRKNIALVPQDPILFHRSLAENIAYGKPDATQEEIETAAKLAHAHEFIEQFPQQYQTLVGERGIKLSGGERQRVAIARAILANTPILILDEATSSLDSESEKYIQDALEHLLKGKTAIIIAHRLSTIKKVDRILVFDKGEIIEDGNFEALLKQDGIFAKLWKLQKLN